MNMDLGDRRHGQDVSHGVDGSFFTTTPILQLELMLAQNVSWLAILLWLRPFTNVPSMGGPLEKIYEDEHNGQTGKRWSSGNIVEIGIT
tara:strand:- start:341 stop:607 length:267 start_codon:yes stop_codon:yes gene_type:complete